jgi:hypothetical protein
MPAFDCNIDHGSLPSGEGCDIVDEIGLLVNSLNISATREKKIFKGSAGCTEGLRYQDPTLTFDFDGYVATADVADDASNLSKIHPGTAVASIANYTGAIYGFDPADGVLVMEDPVLQLSNEDLCKAQAKIVQHPFVS